MFNIFRHTYNESTPIKRLASVPGCINLDRKGIYVHQTKKPGAVISAQQGLLYITQENDFKDHVLLAGDSIQIQKPGKILIEAMFDSEFYIQAGSQ
jgi:hypothetical protein